MTPIYQLEDAKLQQPSVVSIGVFDGVHRGHQYLIKKLVQEAHSSGRAAVALTFFPHPDVVLRNQKGRYYLTPPEERARLLAELGIDCVVIHPFNDEVRQIRAAEFVDRLIEYLNLDSVWIGADFAMGYKREGNVTFLQQQGQEKGFSVRVIDLMQTENPGEVISSSTIRELLSEGAVDRVQDLLGRSYAVSGKVVRGEQRGRKIGFPTANIDVWDEQVIPANGVYAGWATLGDERFMAVTNVGVRPTFDGENITVEAHLLDFDRDIYGQILSFAFEQHLRSEMKFSGIDELIAQIGADADAARTFLQAQVHS